MPLQKLLNALLAPATVESQSLDTPMVLSWYARNATAMAQFNLHNQSLPRTQRKWTRLVVRQIWMFRHAGGLTTVCMGRLHSVRKRPMQQPPRVRLSWSMRFDSALPPPAPNRSNCWGSPRHWQRGMGSGVLAPDAMKRMKGYRLEIGRAHV